ncbi:GNAT family N-acetyltransferase [Roseibium sediminicola]|uniref:GNAT family N-acetyltransferase n=1 Tax=Roseibium sediminicola TaxID=2933272 RepID=A0ABT0GRV3_9HYPH|nr:GNAT family N-acetyltransferase [Roseibium sp. CAU 1639]MCK7612173.1 GNAT family N-acetyltransferase [Roseibium sp. CAU 1639]
MTNITVRALERADKAAWLGLWLSYLSFYEQELAEEVTETLFERLLSAEGHRAQVAEQDGKLVGFVHYLFHDSTWSSEATCYLEDLFVSLDLRGGGAGRKLIEAVYAAADAEPTASGNVYWHTHDHNARARLLYDRIGVLSEFVRYDRPK